MVITVLKWISYTLAFLLVCGVITVGGVAIIVVSGAIAAAWMAFKAIVMFSWVIKDWRKSRRT